MHKKMINEAMRIAGEKVTSEKTIDVEYPFTGDVIGTVPAGTAEHARKALDIAANYQPKLTRYERQKILQTAAEALVKRKDEISENQNGMNLPLVTRGGFIRDCIFATEDVINVKYDVDEIEEKIWRYPEGNNPRNSCNYIPSFYMAPFGFNYFDQDGQLWRISDVGKAVQLASEWEKDFVNDDEDAVEYYVSH